MTAPLFEITGDDGETLSAYEATDGTGVVLVPSDRGRPSHGIQLNPGGMTELARKLIREVVRLSPETGRQFQEGARLMEEIAAEAMFPIQLVAHRETLEDLKAEAEAEYPICPPGEHEFVCGCGDDADHPPTDHGPIAVGCYACQRPMTQIEQEQALPHTRSEQS